MQMLIGKLFIIPLILVQLTGCVGPYVYQNHTKISKPVFTREFAVMADGYRLPLVTMTGQDNQPRAIVLALHGFNDYNNAFSEFGSYLVGKNISLIAYDQRGFGRTKGSGYWHGANTLVEDLLTMVHLTRQQYKEVPLYILGDSMGGAVVLASLKSLQVQGGYDGLILVAPAVWAKDTMPWYQQLAMWFFAHVLPWFAVSGKGLDITPSDNIEMLRALGRDPLVIKETRADSIYGLSNLMDMALASSASLNSSTLILYGKHDEIIPRQPTCVMLKKLPSQGSKKWRFILYEDGYHMLTRDLQAERVYMDIEAWISNRMKNNELQQTGTLKEDIEFICQ